jgi:hypothetical protein
MVGALPIQGVRSYSMFDENKVTRLEEVLRLIGIPILAAMVIPVFLLDKLTSNMISDRKGKYCNTHFFDTKRLPADYDHSKDIVRYKWQDTA